MFGVDFSELALVFVVALLVLGPTRLPGLVRKVGTWVGKARGMARQFREQLESEVNLEELNRMTEARAKEARSAPPPMYPPPPPEFGGEPMGAAAQTPAQDGEATEAAAPATAPDVYSPEAMAASEPAEPEYVVPPPGDASHNDLSEPPEHPQDSPHGRAG
jgi:sec-independent protein translocase protein TatB